MAKWKKDGYQRYRLGETVIERTSNSNALRKWYVIEGPHAFGRGLKSGLTGGFFKLASAKKAVEEADH